MGAHWPHGCAGRFQIVEPGEKPGQAAQVQLCLHRLSHRGEANGHQCPVGPGPTDMGEPYHPCTHKAKCRKGQGNRGLLLTPQQIFPVLASKKAGGDVSHMETGPMDQQHKISIYKCFFPPPPRLFFMRFPFDGAKTAAVIHTQPPWTCKYAPYLH